MIGQAKFEEIKELAFGSISGAYALVGTTEHPVRIVNIKNGTEGTMFFSTDGTTDEMVVFKGTGEVYDISANRGQKASMFVFPVGTTFYVKQISAPTSGSVYIECIY